MMFPDFPEDKTAKVVHYVVAHTEPSHLGATKLNRVMWHADVLHYRRYGKTITGQHSYVRLQNGPIPNGIYQTIDALKEQGAIVERAAPTPSGVRREFFDIERPDPSWFTPEEIETLHEAINFIAPLTAAEARERTHGPIWDELLNNQQMPIRAASIVPSEVQPDEVDWALENADEFKGDTN